MERQVEEEKLCHDLHVPVTEDPWESEEHRRVTKWCYGSYSGRCLRGAENQCKMSLWGSGAADRIPSRSLSEMTGKNGGPLPSFSFTLDVPPPTGPHCGSAGSSMCWRMGAGMFTEAGMILLKLGSPVLGLPLLRSSPCRTSSPSASLVNPSKNNSPDRLEKHNPQEHRDGRGETSTLCS